MSDHTCNKKKQFNFPSYINTPFFLYHDSRLDKPATNLASFFYSLYSSGQEITASIDYLCELVNIKRRQYYNIMNQLEELQYIKRTGFTNRQKIHWIYIPQSSITIEDQSKEPQIRTSASDCTSVQNNNNIAKNSNDNVVNNLTLVQSSAVNLCTPLHTYTKEDTKVSKKTSTSKNPSISFFFSSSVDRKLVALKLPQDRRSDEEFLLECKLHVDTRSDKSHPYLKRANSLAKLLAKLKDEGKIFFVSGTKSQEEIKKEKQSNDPGRAPTKEEWDNWKSGIQGFEWVNAWRLKQQG